jgi:hypothetical protein
MSEYPQHEPVGGEFDKAELCARTFHPPHEFSHDEHLFLICDKQNIFAGESNRSVSIRISSAAKDPFLDLQADR